jgi:hypothetical protein
MGTVVKTREVKERYAVCDQCGWETEHGSENSFPLAAPQGWIEQRSKEHGTYYWCSLECVAKWWALQKEDLDE